MADTPTTDGAPDPHATNTGGSPLIERAYSLSDPDEARALYDEWAGTYDDDLASDSQGYVAPAVAADAVASASGVDGEILDAGCGTGLVGVALAERGARSIDGVDLSPGMLAKAKETGVYRRLAPADLSRPLPVSADSYDVVVCVGTLTHGHVGPGGVRRVRPPRPAGRDDRRDRARRHLGLGRIPRRGRPARPDGDGRGGVDRRRRLPQGGRGERPDGGPAGALTARSALEQDERAVDHHLR